MLWHWLKLALVFVLRLVIPNPYPAPKRISKDRPCTVCGNQGGNLRFDWYQQAQSPMEKKPMVIHQCSTCGFMEAFDPIGIPKHPVDFNLQLPQLKP